MQFLLKDTIGLAVTCMLDPTAHNNDYIRADAAHYNRKKINLVGIAVYPEQRA